MNFYLAWTANGFVTVVPTTSSGATWMAIYPGTWPKALR